VPIHMAFIAALPPPALQTASAGTGRKSRTLSLPPLFLFLIKVAKRSGSLRLNLCFAIAGYAVLCAREYLHCTATDDRACCRV
jgi:hypothetical protein